MANILTIVTCAFFSLILLGSIWFAGPDLILPASFMIVAILVGGLCLNIAASSMKEREALMKDWAKKNPM